jgi:hypothetical protein
MPSDWKKVLADFSEALAAGRQPEDVQAERHARVADLLHRLTLIAVDISTRADIGPYEVGVLQQLMQLAGDISGVTAEQEALARVRRYHWRGRAVDVPPARDPLATWLRKIRP